MEPVPLLIVGGSFAGLALHRGSNGRAVVVEPRYYAEYTPGVPRCIVAGGSSIARMVFPLPVPADELISARVRRIDAARRVAVLDSGREVAYETVVVAAGRPYPPFKGQVRDLDARREELRALHQKLRAAASVLVVGGGAVAVELAAEIAHRFRADKQVTVVSSSGVLLPGLPAAAQACALRWLQRHGVRVLLGDRVLAPPTSTQNGVDVESDLTFWCVGGGSSAATAGADDPINACLAGRGSLSVGPRLDVSIEDGIYAAGDAAGGGEAYDAEIHAMYLADETRQPGAAAAYGGAPRLVCLSLGPREGIIIFNGLALTALPWRWLGGAVKAAIEFTKIAQIKRRRWAGMLWVFGDRLSLWLHRVYTWVVG